MKTIFFSIIIPHYNIPDLLMRCLNSIPVRSDIQVIVVDDCSPNADTYIEKYPELSRPYLEYYSTPQGGSAGRARNIGLDHAKGKWIICMDADDLFVDDMEDILASSINMDDDIIYYSYKTVLSDNLSKEGNRGEYQKYFTTNCIADESLFRYCFDPMWGKIFKRDMIERYHIRCDEIRYGNDVGFSFKCGALARKIAVINRPFFIITQREGSLASCQFTANKCSEYEYQSRLEAAFGIVSFIRDNNMCINNRLYVKLCYDYIKDWPYLFFKYYFSSILIKHPTLALSLPLFFIHRGLMKTLRALKHILKEK